MACRALEERNGAKLNRAAGLQPLPNRKDGEIAERADFAHDGLCEDGKVFQRRGEFIIVFDKVNVDLVKVRLESGMFHCPCCDHDTLVALSFHEQRHEPLE
jgi:hypothetical protein